MPGKAVDPQELARYHLFSVLERDQLARVQAATRILRPLRGEVLFTQGEPARQFFLVRAGAMKLSLLSREGVEKVVEVIRPGQFFAEAVAFMETGRYPVNAEALEDSELLAFDNAVFKTLILESRPLALRLLAALSRRMHALLNEIDELTLHNATYRTVAYLLNQAREQGSATGVALTIPKQVIASRLSITPETFSRIQARLKEQGLIRIEGDGIILLDTERLRALLEE